MLSYDPNHDAYVILGADPGATQEQIEEAFRQAVRTWHPDKSPAPDAAARFRDVQEAAKILRNPERRAHYDRLRALRLGKHAHTKPKKKPPERAQPNVPMRPPPSWLAPHVHVRRDTINVPLQAPRPLHRTVNFLGAAACAALGAGIATSNLMFGALALTLWAIRMVVIQPPHAGSAAWVQISPGARTAQFHSLDQRMQRYTRLEIPWNKLRISIHRRKREYAVRMEGVPRVDAPVLIRTRCPDEAVRFAAEAGRWFELTYQSRAA